MRLRTILLSSLCGSLVGLFEVTFVSFLPKPFSDLHLVLPLIILGILLQRFDVVSVFGVSAGVLVDVFTIGPTSFASARNLAIALIIAFLARTVVTNQSVYAAFALMCAARGMEWVWQLVASLFWKLSSSHALSSAPGVGSVLRTLMWDELFLAACFMVWGIVLRRFITRRPQNGR